MPALLKRAKPLKLLAYAVGLFLFWWLLLFVGLWLVFGFTADESEGENPYYQPEAAKGEYLTLIKDE